MLKSKGRSATAKAKLQVSPSTEAACVAVPGRSASSEKAAPVLTAPKEAAASPELPKVASKKRDAAERKDKTRASKQLKEKEQVQQKKQEQQEQQEEEEPALLDSEVVTVTIPAKDTDFDEYLRGKPFKASVVGYLAECGGFIVQPLDLDNKTRIIVPSDMVTDRNKDEQERREHVEVQYRISDDIQAANGNHVGGNWVNAVILEDFGDDEVLLRLPDYASTCFWSGFVVCKKSAKGFRASRTPLPRENKRN